MSGSPCWEDPSRTGRARPLSSQEAPFGRVWRPSAVAVPHDSHHPPRAPRYRPAARVRRVHRHRVALSTSGREQSVDASPGYREHVPPQPRLLHGHLPHHEAQGHRTVVTCSSRVSDGASPGSLRSTRGAGASLSVPATASPYRQRESTSPSRTSTLSTGGCAADQPSLHPRFACRCGRRST